MATDRRRLISAGLAAATGLAACQKKAQSARAGADGVLHLFPVENGAVGQPGFSVGLLATRDPAALVLALATLRRQSRFRTDLSFASTNRYKLAYLEPAFKHLAGDPAVKLTSVTAPGFTNWAGRPAAARQAAHASLYRRLVEAIPAAERPGLVVHLARRSSGGVRDGKLQADLQAALGSGATVVLDGARFRDMVELASVVFGAVRYAPTSGRSRVKRRTVEMLKAALSTSSLDAAALNASGRLTTSSMAL